MGSILKYGKTILFNRGKIVNKFLIAELEDLQKQINEISGGGSPEGYSAIEVKENVNLTAQSLGGAFGAASNFDGVGVVKNEDGVYLVVSDGSAYKYSLMEDL